VVALIGVSIIVFMLARITGDPTALLVPYEATQEDVDSLRAMLGLDKPLYVQYWKFISMIAQGDFGVSLKWNRPCLSLFLERFPATLLLASAAMVWSLIIGILIGIRSAVKVGGWFDNFGRTFALLGQGLPHFWLGLMLILLFAVKLRWLPSSGFGSFQHLIMPSFTLGWFLAASLTRLTRSTMLDVLDTNYITMARVKGVPEKAVITKHAFKNAMIPVVTMAAMNFVIMLNGTVMTETVFNWPGVGRLIVDAILARDYMVVQACVLIASILFVLINLLIDILYAYIDPRIRYE
jgi:peptide/nickel transport system permease protein